MQKKITFSLMKETDIDEIASLLSVLWKRDQSERLKKFKWKYLSRVNSPSLGIVARCESKIVGFRGLIPSNWKFNEKVLKILFTADAVVDSNYRGHKILEKMNIVAMENYSYCYDYFIMASSNTHSAYVSKKQGAEVFMNCIYMRSYLFQNFIYQGKIFSKNILNELAIEKIFNRENHNAKISMLNKKDHYLWKIRDPDRNFYFEVNGSEYIIYETSGTKIEVLDYSTDFELVKFKKLFNNMLLNLKPKSIIWPLYGNSGKNIHSFLKDEYFFEYSFLKKIKKDIILNRQLLIRPVKKDFTNSDWFINGIDIRSQDLWDFRHINYV